MANEIAVRADLSAEQIDLIKRTIAQGASNDELNLFIQVCNRTGLDPFLKQIYAVKRWDSKAKREVMTVQVGIDGLRLVAARTGELDGQQGPFWCGEDEKWKEVWLSPNPPCAAKVAVYRKGCSHPFVGIARFDAYKQTTKEGTLSYFWLRMPDLMIAKVAESLALRKAFPAELSSLYVPEEMDQEGEVQTVKQEPQPTQSRQIVLTLPADSQKMLLDQLHKLDRSWYAEKTKAWASKVLGREIPANLHIGELSQEEADKLYAELEIILRKTAGAK